MQPLCLRKKKLWKSSTQTGNQRHHFSALRSKLELLLRRNVEEFWMETRCTKILWSTTTGQLWQGERTWLKPSETRNESELKKMLTLNLFGRRLYKLQTNNSGHAVCSYPFFYFIYLSIYRSMCLFTCLSIYLSTIYVSIYLFLSAYFIIDRWVKGLYENFTKYDHTLYLCNNIRTIFFELTFL